MPVPPVPPHRPRPRRWRPLRGLECVLLGDGAVGKTSLALSYSSNGFPARYVPTALDRFSAVVQVDGAPIRLQLCDTAGQDEFDALWQACCPKADVCLLCFSVVAPTSFQNIVDKWYPEVRRHCPSAPVLLVGTQSDLRQDVKMLIALSRHQEKPVPPTAARSLARKLGMAGYVECSALTQQNLKEVFDTAIVLGLRAGEGPKGQRAPPAASGPSPKTGGTSTFVYGSAGVSILPPPAPGMPGSFMNWSIGPGSGVQKPRAMPLPSLPFAAKASSSSS